ncbi:MAG: AAA family ATPase [Vulcanimicrobiota bacterium]
MVLVGCSGAGKSTFAARHFLPTQIVSSDTCRALVGDDPNDQTVTPQAFALVDFLIHQRLSLKRLTVVDATSVKPEDRKRLRLLAKEHDLPAVAIVLDVDRETLRRRRLERSDRSVPEEVLQTQFQTLRDSLSGLARERFKYTHHLRHGFDQVEIQRVPLRCDRRYDPGPFDIIGDLHGCYPELLELLGKLGYQGTTPPPGRRALFLGDLTDRGPDSPACLRLVMDMVGRGQALCVPGNHDDKLVRWLKGAQLKVGRGLETTVAQLEGLEDDFRQQLLSFYEDLPTHYVLDGGNLVVAHGGMPEHLQGRSSGRVRSFALYGDTTGKTDAQGFPIRRDWARDYRGQALVVYGHTPIEEAQFINNTINIDTGAVFGGRLTCLRYPERELVSVPAQQTYYEHPLAER